MCWQICGYDSARGDQCDNCGNQLDPIDLINPRSRVNGETPQFVQTQQFFLDLPALAEALDACKDTHRLAPERPQVSLNLLEDLRPRAMTRDIDWGVPVPLSGWEDNPSKRRRGGSTPWSGTSRRRSSGLAVPAAATSGSSGGAIRRGVVVLLHGQGQHHVPLADLAAELLGYSGRGAKAGEPGSSYGRSSSPTEVVLQRVPHDGGSASSRRRAVS